MSQGMLAVRNFVSQIWSTQYLKEFFGVIGGATILRAAFHYTCKTLSFFNKDSHEAIAKKYGAQEGAWVLVTGASDGIGKGYCEVFTELGFNIILVARNEAKLKQVASELTKLRNDVQTKVIVFDFSKLFTLEEYKLGIADKVKDLNIRIVINNVGVMPVGPSVEFYQSEVEELMHVNVYSIILTIRCLLDLLKTKSPGKHKGIINTGAGFGYNIFMPQTSWYSGTKGFGHFISEGLHNELKSSYIDVLYTSPGGVESSQTGGLEKTLFIPTRSHTDECIKNLGIHSHTCGNWQHSLPLNLVGDGIIPLSIFKKEFLKVIALKKRPPPKK